MRVLVTGGSGKLGRAVVNELVTHAWDVANVDATPPRDARSAFTRIDVTDYGQVVEAFRKPLGEHGTLLSIDKARRVLGYEPAHSWRTT